MRSAQPGAPAVTAVQLDRVAIHGPTLAALLQSVLTGGRAADGLLFGGVTSTTSVQAHDAAGGGGGSGQQHVRGQHAGTLQSR